MPRQVIRLSEGLGGALFLLMAVSVTVFLAFVLAVNESPPLNQNGDGSAVDELVLATDTPFWVAGQPVISTGTPAPTSDTAVPTLLATAVVLPSSLSDTTPTPEIICVPPPSGWLPHTVQPTDSLTGLAIQNGVTSAELMRVNCLTTAVLYVGMTVYLPSQAPTRVACGPPTWWGRYLVQRGDTLYSLASRYGTTIYQIINANCMVGTQLTAGRYIYLPPMAVVSPPTATPLPTLTATIPTPSPTDTPTTATAVPPTPTSTGTPTNTPFPTFTPAPPTATFTPEPSPPATTTATATSMPPTTTFTPVPATATFTPVPPTRTATFTPVPPTPTATFTPAPPTPTATLTPVPPTSTATFTPEP